jgi:hypothetical protein
LWVYSKSLWTFRNSTIHGFDIQDQRQKEKERLHGKVEALFEKHSTDPFFISQSMNHLFHKPMQYILAMDRDAIACWIKSVEEASLTLARVELASKDSIIQFLQPRRKAAQNHPDPTIQPHATKDNSITLTLTPSPPQFPPSKPLLAESTDHQKLQTCPLSKTQRPLTHRRQ